MVGDIAECQVVTKIAWKTLMTTISHIAPFRMYCGCWQILYGTKIECKLPYHTSNSVILYALLEGTQLAITGTYATPPKVPSYKGHNKESG